MAETPETASRLRGRIEHILDAARAKGFRHEPILPSGGGIWTSCYPSSRS